MDSAGGAEALKAPPLNPPLQALQNVHVIRIYVALQGLRDRLKTAQLVFQDILDSFLLFASR